MTNETNKAIEALEKVKEFIKSKLERLTSFDLRNDVYRNIQAELDRMIAELRKEAK
jgi:hypothetical protein